METQHLEYLLNISKPLIETVRQWPTEQIEEEQERQERQERQEIALTEKLEQYLKSSREERLGTKHQFSRKRFRIAFIWSSGVSSIITALVLIFLIMISEPQHYVLYEEFVGWKPCTSCDKVIAQPVSEEISHVFTTIVQSLRDFIASTSFVDENGEVVGNIAGIARIAIVVSVSLAGFLKYRELLKDRYELNGQRAQKNDYDSMSDGARLAGHFVYAVATAIGTYAVISVFWLALSQMFKPMPMPPDNLHLNIQGWWPFFIIFLSTVSVTFAATYVAIAISTRELLLLGLFTFTVGLAVSATLADPSPANDGYVQWWYWSISNIGKGKASAPLFIATLLSVAFVVALLWFDIDSLIRQMLKASSEKSHDETLAKDNNGEASNLSKQLARIKRWIATRSTNKKMWAARFLYFSIAVGVALVGLIRTEDVWTTPYNWFLHTGGASAAIVCVVVLSILIPAVHDDWFDSWYIRFSTYGVAIIFISAVVLTMFNIINTTIEELVLFGLLGVWLYLTVDNLVGQANVHFTSDDKEDLQKLLDVIRTVMQTNPSPESE